MTIRPTLCAALVILGLISDSPAQDAIHVAEGLRIRLIADDDLVPDCTNLVADDHDRVFASGPGYVRRLVDQNSDGLFDTFSEIVEGLKHGAHGLFSEDFYLYFVADGGIWKVRISEDGMRRESEPQRVLAVKTGGEHDAHALRRGPDGFWYLIAGNGATEMFELQNVDNPRVSNPRAGAIWRISDNWETREVWAHGFRNAFDFDFGPNGTIVTFDSDGERDVSLPWYRPTRVYSLRPGDDAGWMSRSWKRDNYEVGMPRVLAEFGRGSPTGVVRYRGSRLPVRFTHGSFVLDWTFGRVFFVSDDGNTELVAEPIGTTGFAVTDVVELRDGRLLLSVGGRGSRGGLYELDAEQPNEKSTPTQLDWKGIPPSRSAVESRVLALRAKKQTQVSLDDLNLAAQLLSGADDVNRVEPDTLALLTLINEALGGLGEASAHDSRSSTQRAAVFDSLRSQLPPAMPAELKSQLTRQLVNILIGENATHSMRTEVVRTLAVLEAEDPVAMVAVLQDMNRCDDPTDKLHRLFALGRLPGSRDQAHTGQVAEAMLEIPMQLADLGRKIDQNWAPRLAECLTALQQRDPALALTLVGHPLFGHSTHLPWIEALPASELPAACDRLLQNRTSANDPAVAMFVARSQQSVSAEVLQRWLSDDATKPAAWLILSHHRAAEHVGELQQAAYALDPMVREAARAALVALHVELKENSRPSTSVEQWLNRLPEILTLEGESLAGEKLFAVRQCANCHNAAKALGPSLAGISKRFGDQDILLSLVDPSQVVPDRYRAIQVLTEDGNVLRGLRVYESVDGVTLITADAKTIRINADAIEHKKLMSESLMPEGLLDGLSGQQVADLLSYLRSQ